MELESVLPIINPIISKCQGMGLFPKKTFMFILKKIAKNIAC